MFNLGLEAIQLNRIRTMYHSSPIENLDSILTKGLIINSETTYEGFLKPIVKATESCQNFFGCYFFHIIS